MAIQKQSIPNQKQSILGQKQSILGAHQLNGEAESYQLGCTLAPFLRIGDIIALKGGLGSGKTCLARGVIQTLLKSRQNVPSPSFTLIQTYPSIPAIWHIDLYRLDKAQDILELGIFDALSEAALLIEWPEKMGTLLPENRLDIEIQPENDFRQRRALISACGKEWQERLKA